MDEDKRLPVLIVGAGPTGLTTAIELARRGVGVRIVDAAPGPRDWARATVVHGRTLEIFESLGIAEAELGRGVRSKGVNFYSRGAQTSRMDFESVASRYPFELMISEEETEAILRSRLAVEGVETEWDLSLVDFTRDARSVRCLFQRADESQEIVHATWLVGCEGWDSRTRRLLGESFDGFDYEHEWAVLDCRLEGWPLADDEATVFLEHEGLVFLPLPGGRWRVYFRPAGAKSDLEADVRRGLEVHLPGVTMRDVGSQARFRAGNRIVEGYRHGQVFLAGDAAHVCSPIEGHGLNTGIQDAHNLAWKLSLVETGVCADILLESYDAERRPVADAIRASGDEAERNQQLRDPRQIVRRDTEMVAVDHDPLASRHRAEATSELVATYRGSPIVGGDPPPRYRAAAAGDRLPEAGTVTAPGGSDVDVHQLTHRTTHTLLCLVRGAPDEATVEALRLVDAVARENPDLVGASFVVCDEPTADPDLAPVWHRAGAPTVFDTLGVDSPTLLLVRPDRFVALRTNEVDASRVETYVAELRQGRVSG